MSELTRTEIAAANSTVPDDVSTVVSAPSVRRPGIFSVFATTAALALTGCSDTSRDTSSDAPDAAAQAESPAPTIDFDRVQVDEFTEYLTWCAPDGARIYRWRSYGVDGEVEVAGSCASSPDESVGDGPDNFSDFMHVPIGDGKEAWTYCNQYGHRVMLYDATEPVLIDFLDSCDLGELGAPDE